MIPPSKATFLHFFRVFGPTQKIAWDGPKWGWEVLFPANPNLADILDKTDFDFEIFPPHSACTEGVLAG